MYLTTLRYKRRLKRALRYLSEHHFKVVVTGYDNFQEVFVINPQNHSIMDCVDVIRDRMSKLNYKEAWIDADWITLEGYVFEIVTYLYFCKYSETVLDERGHFEIEKEQAFWFKLTNEQ